jgi:Zn-dependent peptidase ImmA (M78 family)
MMIRERAGVDPLEPLNARALAGKLRLQIIRYEEIEGLPLALHQALMMVDAREWSGMGKELPSGELLVALNPNMTVEREAVTIMEEVAHAHYGHQPADLTLIALGFTRRAYSENDEREAFWTAGAALLPSKAVGLATYRGESAADLAVAYDVSVELAEMRMKTLRLWSHATRDSLPTLRVN